MTWASVSPTVPARGAVRVETVDGAVLTPVARGQLRSLDGPRWWMTGAVHDAQGRLVVASQRTWTGSGNEPLPADPDRVPVPAEGARLRGTWLYAGHWTRHFGHFLVETLTNLWPEPDTLGPVDGIVAHRSFRGTLDDLGTLRARPLPWQEELLDLAGHGRVKVRVVHARPAHVERLVVPGRPVLLKAFALPQAADLWRRLARAAGTGAPAEGPAAERVFLSRSRFHQLATDAAHRRTGPAWDALLDRLFADAGFQVVHPETLPVADQVRLVAGATVVAGSSGSALHLAGVAPPGLGVLEVGDARTPHSPLPAQRTVNAVCGHRAAFVPYGDEAALRSVLAGLGRSAATR